MLYALMFFLICGLLALFVTACPDTPDPDAYRLKAAPVKVEVHRPPQPARFTVHT
jgi:hypothetical protein